MKNRAPALKIAIVIALFLATIISMFSWTTGSRQTGSTYNRAPEGYGAWYAELQAQPGMQVERWQRPLAELVKNTSRQESGQVLLRVATARQLGRSGDDPALSDWLDAGNILITVGGVPPAPVTAAPFHSEVESPQGSVVLDTRRRAPRREDVSILLADEHGAIAWSHRQGSGQRIRVITPYLAANAYQDAPGNFAFLTALVTNPKAQPTPMDETMPDAQEVTLTPVQTSRQLWVDEYLHGHVDAPPPDVAAAAQTIWGYLRQTPLAIVALQGAIALVIVLLALNQRFGLPQPNREPSPNNSQVYIEALAAVLSKAEQQSFVVELLTPEHQRQLQLQLGLGSTLLTEVELLAAWQQQTGQPSEPLAKLLRSAQRKRAWSKAQLVQWLQHWQQLHQSCRDSANVLTE
ncbi:MAG: DUF4350 domain-containing protein [Spirulinaceae cyanobacterium]